MICTFAGGLLGFHSCIFDEGTCEERKTEEGYFLIFVLGNFVEDSLVLGGECR